VARFSETLDFDISSGWGLSGEDYEFMLDTQKIIDTYGSIIVAKFRGF
jgi:hypothetical protein